MKKQILIFGLFLIPTLIYSQINIDSLIQTGIQYHENGQFDKAIEAYKTALEIEPNSPLINYEIAMTYMYAKDYKNSIIHCDKVIELNDKYLLQAYITKGSSLDYLGETKKSIKLFEAGIKKFGAHHLLYYNLGYNYYNLKEYDKAEEALINAIEIKSDHASSHLLLGYLMTDKNQKVQSLLCLHYFLFLEPNSERAKTAYNLIQKQFSGNVGRDEDNPSQINIILDPNQLETEFGAAGMMISMLEASKSLEENKGKSGDELFIENTTSFFKILGELKKKKNTGLWWDFYVPLFYDIAKSEHIDTYCYYISQSSNDTALEWLRENDKRIDDFNRWLSEQ
ncbi:MAG: tetratricopeptide repeat protein [Lentimicrobiaceae bacterium]|nr:tetratricopeptide repeat protein [Lentimicrobiaceae bacterium]MCB9023566.1 tetratricopeptide repeat protein [Lentimicrobiaceae bacterium]MCO5264400.1 tetratricopeptide repeat protein [Lentimicrobium sp.]